MKTLVRISIATLICTLISYPIYAAGTSSAQFLKMGAGARAAGMGDAFASISNDVTATYWNPAGLAQLKSPEIAAMQSNSLVQTQYQYFGAGMPLTNGGIGLIIQRMDFGTMDAYSAADVKTGNFSAGSFAGGLCGAIQISENIDVGITGKYIAETIESKKASALAGDVGIILKRSLFNRFNFGFSLQNIGSQLQFINQSESLPQTIRAGMSGKFFNDQLLTSVDYSLPNDNSGTIHGGLEFLVNPHFVLRGGFQTTPGNELKVEGIKGLTAGIGINVASLTFDYAFVPYGDLGQVHRFSALFHFNS